jgi:transposase
VRKLAAQFRVSWGYSKKIRAQQLRSGQKGRPVQLGHGPSSRINAAVQESLRAWLRAQPDLAAAGLHERLAGSGVQVSKSRVGQVQTTIGAMSLRDSEAAMAIEEATDGDIFLAYVEQVLCPKLQRSYVVLLDNLSAHKVRGIRERIESRGAQLIDLSPYSPDLNPIEKAWSKFKQYLRAAKARTAEALDQAIAEALQTVTAQKAAAWLRHCGYQGTASLALR